MLKHITNKLIKLDLNQAKFEHQIVKLVIN